MTSWREAWSVVPETTDPNAPFGIVQVSTQKTKRYRQPLSWHARRWFAKTGSGQQRGGKLKNGWAVLRAQLADATDEGWGCNIRQMHQAETGKKPLSAPPFHV